MSRLYLDASAFIYLVDGPTLFRDRARTALERFKSDSWATSYFSRLECRVKPLRERDNARLAAFDALLDPKRIELIDVDRRIIDRATEIRAEFGLRAVDALHVASAVLSGCDTALTGDAALSRVTDFRVEIIRP